jgi:succinyl-CoA synthetase alpha subunit
MGKAGAIVSGKNGTIESKLAALRDANVAIADTPSNISDTGFQSTKNKISRHSLFCQ